MAHKISDRQLKDMLVNWVDLNKDLRNLKENDLQRLLRFERDGKNRHTLIRRIYTRYSKMRSKRELDEILKTSPVKTPEKKTAAPKKKTVAKKKVAKKKVAKKKAAVKKKATAKQDPPGN